MMIYPKSAIAGVIRWLPAWLAALCLATVTGCDTKTIQNLGAIEAVAAYRFTGVDVKIFLLTDQGARLSWDTSLVGPVVDVLPVEELETEIAIWSLRNGQRQTRVYAGRLQSLQWTVGYLTPHRSLTGRVPIRAYDVDPEADSPLGEMDITLRTPKQGDFQTTVFNVQVFPASLY